MGEDAVIDGVRIITVLKKEAGMPVYLGVVFGEVDSRFCFNRWKVTF